MPDFNQYESKTPVQRPEQVIGLSQIVYPKYDYVNTFPPTASLDSGGKPEASADVSEGFWIKDASNLNKMFGGVPIAPAAVTPESQTRRFNSDNLKFDPRRNNEDVYADNQSVFSSVGHGLGNLVGKTITDLGTGVGFLAGLVGLGNDSEKYGGGFNGWFAGAADNGIAQYFKKVDKSIQDDWFPIYKKASESEHGFFRHMGDLDFWTDDTTSGLAFVASSFIPGMAISKLGIGANVLKGLAAIKGVGAAEEAGALAEEGLQGTVESQTLEKEGLGANIEKPEVNNTIVSQADGTQEIPQQLKRIDNAKLERSINVGATSMINTASQAMFSASETKDSTYDTLINKKDIRGNNVYTVEQAKQIAAKVAKDSYLMNLGSLALMNLWEANFIFKKGASAANRFSNEEINTSGIFNDAKLADKSLGRRTFDAFKESGKGVLTAGVWLGNMQLAIDRLNNNSDNFDMDFGDKLGMLTKQYFKQLGDVVTGSDPEAAKAIGAGGILGGVLGKVAGGNEGKEAKTAVANLNSQMNAFKELGNIYKTTEDGKIDMSSGTPVLDEEKLKAWVGSYNNVLSLNKLSKNFESRGINELAKIYQDEGFARFAKSHFDQGLGDLLYQKFDDIGNIHKEDLALLGFDPDSKNMEATQKITDLKNKAKTLEKIYNNVTQNAFYNDININTKEGREKQFKITDKMFYLSARAQSLNELIKNSRKEYESVKNDSETYDQSFNETSDFAVTKYNELYEKVQAAKRNDDNLRLAQNYYLGGLTESVSDYYRGIGEQGEPIPETGDEATRKAESDLNKFVEENKETLQRVKKGEGGRYFYEIANKNKLPSAKELERQQIVQAEAQLAHNATLSVLSRLADPKFGVKYFDQVYSKELDRQANEIKDKLESKPTEQDQTDLDNHYKNPANDITKLKSNVTEDDISKAYNEAINDGKVSNKDEIADHLAEKVSKGHKLTDQEEAIRKVIPDEVESKLQKLNKKSNWDELSEQRRELEYRRDALEGNEDLTTDQETELVNLNNQIDALQTQLDNKETELTNEYRVDNSVNIKPEDKEKYTDVLNKINRQKQGVQKFDNHYEVNGVTYKKVTSLIGDTISDEQRQDPATQAATSIGNTIDSITKAYFSGGLTDEFKNSFSDKMSNQTYDNIIKSLDKVKADLQKKGIDIIGHNVIVRDEDLKVMGEIDLLGVDKDGKFKIYEVQARRPDVYARYGKRGLGIKIRDIDGKRLSMYRNMFANEYGVVPDEIAVKFPFEVKYDKTNPDGIIDGTRMKEQIRFNPLKNVQIKMKNAEPLRIGSKFNSVDMTRIFLDTFLPDQLQKDKLKFLFRNLSFKEIGKSLTLKIKPSEQQFQEKYGLQSKALAKENVDYTIKKFRDYKNKDERGEPKEFSNLYSLVGNTEISLNYEGTPVGYLSPMATMAYKDIDGNFKVLDENTDAETYSNVTGNDISSYGEFKRVASAYKKLHTELTNRMNESPNKEVSLTNEELSKLIDLKPSVGELDLVKKNEVRPNLKELNVNGVRVGNKTVPTVIHVDENDAVKVLMDKNKKSLNLVKKYQDVDRWANAHIDDIKAAMFDRNGNKNTDSVAVIETPNGEYKIVSLRAKEGYTPNSYDDFVENLGDKVTAATTKNVFKNEGLQIIPKITENTVNIGLKEHSVLSSIYPTEDVTQMDKIGIPVEEPHVTPTEQTITDFLNNASDEVKQDLEDMHLNNREAIMQDFQNGDWSNIQDYLDNFTKC